MAVTIHRLESGRKLRGKLSGDWQDHHLEAIADALGKAKLTATTDLGLAVRDLKLWIAGTAAVLAAFLATMKYFG